MPFSLVSFLLPTLLTLTSAIPLNFTSPELPITNLTQSSRCASPKEYPGFLSEDCFAAVQAVYINYVVGRPDTIFEFRSPSTPPKTLNPTIRTPLVHAVSKSFTSPRKYRVMDIKSWLVW